MRHWQMMGLFGLGAASSGGASAHGLGPSAGFAHGFLHPLSGVDHLVAMAAIGLLAFVAGGRARLWLPVGFMAAMLAGFIPGIHAVPMPGSEAMVMASGALILILALSRRSASHPASLGAAGLMGVFHGHAHGAEMALAVDPLSYATGFLLAVAAIQTCVLGLASALTRVSAALPGTRRLVTTPGA